MNGQDALQLSKARNSSREMREYAFKMEAVKKNLSVPVDKEKKLRESCEGFESIFIQKMWEQMRATVPDGGMLKGREEKFWQGMYDQELAKSMASAGGIGLADMMYEQLSQNLQAAGKSTAAAAAAAGQPSPFAADISPAPLMKTAPVEVAQAPEAPAAKPEALYSEAVQPEAVPAAAEPAEETPDPAVMAALDSARALAQNEASAREAFTRRGAPAAMPGYEGIVKGGAQPPLPPMENPQPAMQPAEPKQNLVSTLSRPVSKPVSGKRTVMPRGGAGPRMPAGQPVNRNMPFAAQETQRAQAEAQLKGGVQPSIGTSLPGPAAAGQSSVGVEALNGMAAQQKAQYAPEAAGAVFPKVGG